MKTQAIETLTKQPNDKQLTLKNQSRQACHGQIYIPTKLFSMLTLLIMLASDIGAQTLTNEEILHNRYWTYRERFRKFFTIINEKAGSGLPFSDIVMQDWLWVQQADANGNPVIPATQNANTHGKLNVGGDVTAYMAEYMGILATEYWLLKNDKQENTDEYRAVLNELYFVINAMERLDMYSSEYYTGTSSNNKDGFFVRDDAPTKIVQDAFNLYDYPKVYWQTSTNAQGWQLDDGLSVLTPPSNRKFVGNYVSATAAFKVIFKDDKGNNSYYDERTRQSNMNEMSQDQLIGVLFGFKCIMKFVDDYIEVDPDGDSGPLPKKNLKNWVKEQTDKMMLHLTKTTYDVPFYDDEKIESLQKEMCKRMNEEPWVNPWTGARYKTFGNCKDLSLGADCFFDKCDDPIHDSYVPPNPKLAAHANYVITNPHIPGDKGVYRGSMAFGFGYPLEKLGEEITGKDYPDVKVTLSVGAHLKTGLIGVVPWIAEFMALGRPFQPHNASWWRDAYNFLGKNQIAQYKIAETPAAGMFIWLPAASGTWTQNQYYDLMKKYNRKEAVLFWAVLNDEQPLMSSSNIEASLLSSECSGVQNTRERYDRLFNRVSYFSKMSSDGNSRDEHDNIVYARNYGIKDGGKNTDKDNEIWYNGMDWMLLYNFYRVAASKNGSWENSAFNKKQITGQRYTYKNNYCPCQSSMAFYKDRDVVDNYDKIEVHTRERIHNFNEHITSLPSYNGANGRKALGELKIFYPAYEPLGLHMGDWLTKSITINSGGTLKPLGNLSVCNNGDEGSPGVHSYSTVLVKSGGILSTETNSSTDFRKTIRFGKDSKLEIEGGGVLRIENNTSVIIEEGSALIFHAGARIILNGPEAVLKFDQSTLILGSNAVFNTEGGASGRGYVHFHNDWYPGNRVSVSSIFGNARFALEGTSTDRVSYYDDKLLLVTGNIGLLTDWKLKQFKVAKGFVALGKGSKIISNAEYTIFEHCNINVVENIDNPGYYHGGIEIPGRINNFNDVQIWNGLNAITFYSRGSQGRLTIDGCYFNNCIVPIRQVGGIFKIDDCFVPNPTSGNRLGIFGVENGIKAIGMTGNSSLRGSEVGIIDAIKLRPATQSVRYQGTGNLYLWGNKIHSGLIGLYALDTRVRLKCNTFDYNGWNVRWLRSPSVAIGYGYNRFLNNNVWTHMAGMGQTWTSMLDGFNEFTYPPSNTSGLIFDMDISDKSPFNKATFTFFGQNSGYELMTLDQFTSGSSNPKYRFSTYEQPKTNLSFDYLPDQYASIGTTITNSCTEEKEFEERRLFGLEYPVQSDPMKDYSQTQALSKPLGTKNSVLVTNSGRYVFPQTSESLGNLIQRNFERIYVDDTSANDSAINELSAVLSNNSGRGDLKDSANLVDMYLLYNMLNDAYRFEAIKVNPADSAQSSFDKIGAFYPTLDSMFADMWTQGKSSGSVWSLFTQEIITDWAQLNRLANMKEKAISILDSGILYATDSSYSLGFRSMKCINQFEIMLQQDTGIYFDSALVACPCINSVFSDLDSSRIDIRDTTIHYCDWENTPIAKESSALWVDSGNITRVENVLHPESMIAIDPSGTYRFKQGKFRISYFDSVLSRVSVLNLEVVADTQTFLDSSVSIHFCDMGEYGIYSTESYPFPSLPNRIYNDSTGARKLAGRFQEGSYSAFIYDTLNCSIIRKKILIIGDSAVMSGSADTTIYENDTNSVTLNEFVSSFGGYAILESQNEKSTVSTYLAPCNTYGNYLVTVPDSSGCSIFRYNLTVVSDTVEIIPHDSSFRYCDFGDTLNPSGYYLFPKYQLPYEIYKLGSDTVLITENLLFQGQYQVNFYDTGVCRIFRENITIYSDSVSSIETDSTIGYCGIRFTGIAGCAFFNPVDSGMYSIQMTYPDTAYIYDTCLIAGNYIIKVYDEDSCILMKINLTVYDSLYCSQPNIQNIGNTSGRNDNLYRVYPNPAQDVLNVELLSYEDIRSVVMIDMTGRRVLHLSPEPGQNLIKFDIRELKGGIYTVQTISESGIYQSRLVISR